MNIILLDTRDGEIVLDRVSLMSTTRGNLVILVPVPLGTVNQKVDNAKTTVCELTEDFQAVKIYGRLYTSQSFIDGPTLASR